MPEQLTFANVPASDDHIPGAGKMVAPAPYQPASATSRAAARAMDADREGKVSLQTCVCRAFWNAGPDGLTCEEAAEAVTRLRGRHTKETSINGRVCGAKPELGEWIVNAGCTRANKSGHAADVFVHRLHAERTA